MHKSFDNLKAPAHRESLCFLRSNYLSSACGAEEVVV